MRILLLPIALQRLSNKNIITQADLLNRLRLATISSGLEPTPENFEKIKPQVLRDDR